MLAHTLTTQLHQHFPQQHDFLIGLSGGVDSVVLLHLLTQYPNLNLRAVHIHHGLSPNADHWADFCETLCQQLNIPFELRKVVVKGHQGLEANARAARYQAISETIRPTEVFVTAHHLDDQAETFLLALKRGSGIQGLSAMQVVSNWQNFAIFRPLLDVSKAEILHYADSQKLVWITDESNADNGFDRNFLRNQILPALNQRFTQFNQMVARSAQHCAAQQALIEELLNAELSQRIGEQNQFDIRGFEHFSALKQQQLIRLWLKKNNVVMPSQTQLQAVISALIFAKQDRNPEMKLGDKLIRRYQKTIFVTEQIEKQEPIYIEIPEPSSDKHIGSPLQNIAITRSSTELICTISGKTHRFPIPIELQNQPLILKTGQTGKIQQYGKPHREELKKIWKAHNVPVWARSTTPLLFFQDKLVAVLYS